MGLLKKINKNEKYKNEIIKLVNQSTYFLKNQRTGLDLSKDCVANNLQVINDALIRFENSFGTGEKDLAPAVTIVKNACKELNKASKQNLDSVFNDATRNVVSALTIGSDLLNDLEVPDDDVDQKSQWDKKLDEMKRVNEQFAKLSFDLTAQAKKLESSKTELEDKLLDCEDNGIEAQQIALQLDAVESQINMSSAQAVNFASCKSTTDTIISMAETLIKTSTFSNADYARAKKIIDVKRIKEVYENPKSVQPLLGIIKNELEQFNKDIQARREQAAAIRPASVSSEALEARRAKILQERMAKEGKAVGTKQQSAEEAIVNDLLNK